MSSDKWGQTKADIAVADLYLVLVDRDNVPDSQWYTLNDGGQKFGSP